MRHLAAFDLCSCDLPGSTAFHLAEGLLTTQEDHSMRDQEAGDDILHIMKASEDPQCGAETAAASEATARATRCPFRLPLPSSRRHRTTILAATEAALHACPEGKD